MFSSSASFRPAGPPRPLLLLLASSLVGNVVLGATLLRRPAVVEAEVVPEAPPAELVSNPAVPPSLVPPLPAPLGVNARAGTQVFSALVASSLSQSFASAPPPSPMALAQVYARLFAWDLDLRRDLHRGDAIEVLYEQPETGEPTVLAATLSSQPGTPNERHFAAYRYQAPGDRFPSYWQADGTEVPRRLIGGPLDDYEQITSLLKDRPTHAGMDFKTPLGTPVLAPRAGTVTQVNWNHAANGNCVEVRFSDGVTAKFLHLNEDLVKVGETLSAGEVIGKSGNTGRSTGPHLHYQLDRGGEVLDPVDYHGTLRRTLQASARPEFAALVAQMDEQLKGRLAIR